MIREGIRKLIAGMTLAYNESREIMNEIMSGNATQAQIGAFLTALRMRVAMPVKHLPAKRRLRLHRNAMAIITMTMMIIPIINPTGGPSSPSSFSTGGRTIVC